MGIIVGFKNAIQSYTSTTLGIHCRDTDECYDWPGYGPAVHCHGDVQRQQHDGPDQFGDLEFDGYRRSHYQQWGFGHRGSRRDTTIQATSGSISGSTDLTITNTISGLVGWWPFDEGSGTTAADYSG